MQTAIILDGTIQTILVPVEGFALSDSFHPSFLAGCVDVPDTAQVGWVTTDGGKTFDRPELSGGPTLVVIKSILCADINAQAETQRLKYITGGAGQAMVYLQKQTQAAQALAGLTTTPPMTAQQGAAAFILLAAEIGITPDPTTRAPAVDVFGVARAVAGVVQLWLPLAAAIEAERLRTTGAITAATTADAAQAGHDAVTWPSGS